MLTTTGKGYINVCSRCVVTYICTLTFLCYFLAFFPAAWTVLCQLSHHNHHFVAQKCRGRTCVQCLWTLHETPWGAPPVCSCVYVSSLSFVRGVH